VEVVAFRPKGEVPFTCGAVKFGRPKMKRETKKEERTFAAVQSFYSVDREGQSEFASHFLFSPEWDD